LFGHFEDALQHCLLVDQQQIGLLRALLGLGLRTIFYTMNGTMYKIYIK
jgi:hypothetical protein